MTKKENKGSGILIDIKKTKSEEDEVFDNQYDVLRILPKVKSALKDNVTSDYTLAFLNGTEREYITENYSNAEFAKEIINKYSKNGYEYKWNIKEADWERNEDGSFKKVELSDEDKLKIQVIGSRVFDFFMIQPHLIAILRRNNPENFLVKKLASGGAEEESKPAMYTEDDRGTLQKIKDKLSGEEEVVYED